MNDYQTNRVISLVIPCFNEESVLPMLLSSLREFMGQCRHQVRVLFVNDGSRDRTGELLAAACAGEPRFAMISFSRNFGHQPAVLAGLHHAGGDAVVVLDADLQDPLAVVHQFIAKWEEGFQVVYGVRQDRKESWLLKLCYTSFYRLLNAISRVEVPLDAGDFALMDQRVVKVLCALPERIRYERGLRAWAGYRQAGIPYSRSARAAGHSKYNYSKLIQLAFSGVVAFSVTPLRLSIWLGLGSAALAVLAGLYAIVSFIFLDSTPSGWASLVILLVFFGGLQLVVMGIIGEYLGQVVDEVKARPSYVVEQKAGWVNS